MHRQTPYFAIDRSYTRAVLLAAYTFAAAAFSVGRASAQVTDDPFPRPIEADDGAIIAEVEEFAELPDHDGLPARMVRLIDEPATERLFVNDMYGRIFTVSYDGSEVALYLDLTEHGVQSACRTRRCGRGTPICEHSRWRERW
ncbi:MAG: hypothetical protein WD423_14235 [Rhodothermales bacterium]